MQNRHPHTYERQFIVPNFLYQPSKHWVPIALCGILASVWGAAPSAAKPSKPAPAMKKTAKAAKKPQPAPMMYQCPMCEMKWKAGDAKKHKMKCPHCGVKLVAVKPKKK